MPAEPSAATAEGMKFTVSDPNNAWKLTTRSGVHYFVKSPSKSGAKTFLAGLIGVQHTPFRAEFWAGPAPEGYQLIQAHFLAPHDPANWEPGRV